MKTLKIFFSVLTLALICNLFVACSDDDTDTPEPNTFSTENALLAAQADATIDGTFAIMENGYDENASTTRSSSANSFFPSCTTITLIPNGDGSGTILLDFGTGCQLNNGATVTGQITLAYEPIVNDSRTIEYSFSDFTYNNHGVSGGGQILREFENMHGNPQSTVNESITVSFNSSTVTATRTGLRVAEWTEGVGSGTWVDNVYSITGNWDTTFSNGFQRSGIVTEALIRKLSCLYLVEGTLEITQDGFTGIIDFGNGECDNIAILTVNGQSYTLIM